MLEISISPLCSCNMSTTGLNMQWLAKYENERQSYGLQDKEARAYYIVIG